jgi:hypothetical protein
MAAHSNVLISYDPLICSVQLQVWNRWGGPYETTLHDGLTEIVILENRLIAKPLVDQSSGSISVDMLASYTCYNSPQRCRHRRDILACNVGHVTFTALARNRPDGVRHSGNCSYSFYERIQTTLPGT